MAQSGKERTKKFVKDQKQRGLVLIRVWVPTYGVSKVKELEFQLRQYHEAEREQTDSQPE